MVSMIIGKIRNLVNFQFLDFWRILCFRQEISILEPVNTRYIDLKKQLQ